MISRAFAKSLPVVLTAFAIPPAAAAEPAQPVAQGMCTQSRFTGDPDIAAMRDAILSSEGPAAMAKAAPKLLPKLADIGKEMQQRKEQDWPFLCRYRAENAKLLQSGARPAVIFLGDSITEFWSYGDPVLFGKGVVDRGISAQTSGQILLRFYQDVVALKPAVLHLNAGTNDIGGNGGPAITDDDIINNLSAMTDMAKAHGIRVVLSSILPSTASAQYQSAGQTARIVALNKRIRALAAQRGAGYADYHSVLADADGRIRPEMSNDGVHPNRRGYDAMRPIAQAALAKAKR
ncbi:hypothetical protein L288_10345 [Sphingobium quisquiliarum P25]|uniref:SGNH hydrolase-type esterase domain-containing protein n=1 Tax=Sphingobium quisquiliarum P25 TaxID=1329909 RepID=T0IBN1_9SPHN|nr:GDSL-type esterase/lipase family protein [Sphingobium quisquiliarum]EQB07029.1 hypothetical protein L288_10345 [Sphingobium quisquiliarum P25]